MSTILIVWLSIGIYHFSRPAGQYVKRITLAECQRILQSIAERADTQTILQRIVENRAKKADKADS